MADDSDPMTLDPPGSIAVVGAGPLGIEATLYGRYLGYDTTLFEAESVANSFRNQTDQPLPMLPHESLSPLALSALNAQFPDWASRSLPTTVGDWINNALTPLIDTDLMRGRLRCPARIQSIQTLEIEAESEDESVEDIPPDFQLTFVTDDGQETADVEAVIVAAGPENPIQLGFATPAPYFFCIGNDSVGEAENDLRRGLQEIVAVFASLAGRADLDLYRPRRN